MLTAQPEIQSKAQFCILKYIAFITTNIMLVSSAFHVLLSFQDFLKEKQSKLNFAHFFPVLVICFMISLYILVMTPMNSGPSPTQLHWEYQPSVERCSRRRLCPPVLRYCHKSSFWMRLLPPLLGLVSHSTQRGPSSFFQCGCCFYSAQHNLVQKAACQC